MSLLVKFWLLCFSSWIGANPLVKPLGVHFCLSVDLSPLLVVEPSLSLGIVFSFCSPMRLTQAFISNCCCLLMNQSSSFNLQISIILSHSLCAQLEGDIQRERDRDVLVVNKWVRERKRSQSMSQKCALGWLGSICVQEYREAWEGDSYIFSIDLGNCLAFGQRWTMGRITLGQYCVWERNACVSANPTRIEKTGEIFTCFCTSISENFTRFGWTFHHFLVKFSPCVGWNFHNFWVKFSPPLGENFTMIWVKISPWFGCKNVAVSLNICIFLRSRWILTNIIFFLHPNHGEIFTQKWWKFHSKHGENFTQPWWKFHPKVVKISPNTWWKFHQKLVKISPKEVQKQVKFSLVFAHRWCKNMWNFHPFFHHIGAKTGEIFTCFCTNMVKKWVKISPVFAPTFWR